MSLPDKPINILFCIDSLARGGTELQLIGLLQRVDKKKYRPYLLTIRPTDPGLIPEDCIHLAWDVPNLFAWSGIKALLRLMSFMRRENIQIVQTYFQDSTVFAGLAAWLAGVKVRIACFRDLGFWTTPGQARIMRAALKLMNGFISNALLVRQYFAETFHIAPDRIQVIHNGVDIQSLSFVDHKGPVTDVGIVGNINREVKRTDLFIRAAAIVAKTYPEIRWHIIGDGPLRAGLEDLTASLGIADKIIFTGRLDNVAAYLELVQVGVLCSDSEGLSNALIEYMLKGTAAVATNVGGNPELIVDGQTGLLVPPGNVDALADALLSVVGNTQQRMTLAHSARQSAEKKFSWEKCLAAHDEYYSSWLNHL